MMSSNIERLLKLKQRLEKIKSEERVEPHVQNQNSITIAERVTGKEQKPQQPEPDVDLICIDDDVVCVNEIKSAVTFHADTKNINGRKLLNYPKRRNTPKLLDGGLMPGTIGAYSECIGEKNLGSMTITHFDIKKISGDDDHRLLSDPKSRNNGEESKCINDTQVNGIKSESIVNADTKKRNAGSRSLSRPRDCDKTKPLICIDDDVVYVEGNNTGNLADADSKLENGRKSFNNLRSQILRSMQTSVHDVVSLGGNNSESFTDTDAKLKNGRRSFNNLRSLNATKALGQDHNSMYTSIRNGAKSEGVVDTGTKKNNGRRTLNNPRGVIETKSLSKALASVDDDVVVIDGNCSRTVDGNPKKINNCSSIINPPKSSSKYTSVESEIAIVKTESLSNNCRVTPKMNPVVKVVNNRNGPANGYKFLHFKLDNLHTYFGDRNWIDNVKSYIVHKYSVTTKNCSESDLFLAKFYDTVDKLKVIDNERKYVEVALEALFLKTLFRNSGVSKVTARLMESISPRLITMRMLTSLYLIHLIFSTEKQFFPSNGPIKMYRDAFQEIQFGQRFKEIVIMAPFLVKKELFSLKLRWITILPQHTLMVINMVDFWKSQGLSAVYIQRTTNAYILSLQNHSKIAVGNVAVKSEFKTNHPPKNSCSDSSVLPKKKRVNANASNNSVDVVTVDDSSNDGVEIVEESSKTIKKISQKGGKKRKAGEDCGLESQRKFESEDKPTNNDIMITSMCSIPPTMSANKPGSSTSSPISVSDSSSNSVISEKMNLVLVNGQLVPKLDGKCKKTVEELQQMLLRKKKVPRMRANNRKIVMKDLLNGSAVPKMNNNVRQVQIANVMSQEFVNNLLTPTLANFEIVYDQDGTARTKFTHVT